MRYFDRVIVINVNRRSDRLEQFRKEAETVGFDFEVHSAMDGQFLGMDPIVACRLSHIEVLEKIKPYEMVLICEDDATFVDNFSNRLVAAMENLPEDWDMLYLGANLVDTYEVNHYWHKSRRCCSTHAYAVKKKALPVLIESAKNYDGHIDMGYSLVHPEINAYIARPTLVYQGPGYSDIQGESVDYSHLYF